MPRCLRCDSMAQDDTELCPPHQEELEQHGAVYEQYIDRKRELDDAKDATWQKYVPAPRAEFDFTSAGRRPSAARIIAAWKNAGRPLSFSVTYGETFAAFERAPHGRWEDSGNGCRGVDRGAVVAGLTNGGTD